MFVKDYQFTFKVLVALFDDFVFLVRRIITASHWNYETELAAFVDSFGKCSDVASRFLDDVFDNGQSEAYPFAVLLSGSL